MKKTRVAVVGGGMAALSAVFELTAPSNPRSEEFEVTVYQLGWRLGGKGASGRNMSPLGAGRIEEHGIHNLFGFYDNAFDIIQRCYVELDRPPEHPMPTWHDAFSPESTAVFLEEVDGEVLPWQVFNPATARLPGECPGFLPPMETIALALAFLDVNVFNRPDAPPTPDDPTRLRARYWPVAAALYSLWRAFDGDDRAILALQEQLAELSRDASYGPLRPAFRLLARSLRRAHNRTHDELAKAVARSIRLGRAAMWQVLRRQVRKDHDARRLWTFLNFGSSILLGVIADDVWRQGFDIINDKDFREWLTRHAYDDGGLMLDSVLMRVMYDSSFAYVGGNTTIPRGSTYAPNANYEAGTLLKGLVRASFSYKGAFGWKMLAGTGDVIFAPLYEVLKRRGVRFEFFHDVRALHLNEAGTAIERLSVRRQARPRKEYDPLVTVKGLECWPSEPLFDQLVHGRRLSTKGLDFESVFEAVPHEEHVELHHGRDFDAVLLGVGLGAVPYMCEELIDASPRWRNLVTHVRTTPTQALQVWTKPTIGELGWPHAGRPITGFWYNEASPLNVWVDLTHLIEREDWPEATEPRHLSYFVSPMGDPDPEVLTEYGWRYEGEAPTYGADIVRESSVELLRDYVADSLWPNTAGEFPWDELTDLEDRDGVNRVDGQYYRANLDPSGRYVLSVAGSTRYRLGAHDDGEFENLYLAGDWTKNGLNSGAMESATMSGRLASLAISGFPSRGDIAGADL